MTNKPSGLWSLNFIFACIANFMTGFAFYLLIPTLPFFIIKEFNVEEAVIGAVLSSYVIAVVIIRPVSGFLLDSYDRKTIYILSFVFFAALFFGYIIAYSLILLIFLRFLQGLTWGIATTAGSTIAIDIIPSRRRGEGIGYYGLTINLSMAVGPLAGLFIQKHYPFFYIIYLAIITSFLGLIIALLIKTPPKEKKVHERLSFDRFIMTRGIPIGINFMLLAIPYGMILAFSAMYGTELHVSNTGMFFTYLAAGIGVSRIFSGKLIDKGKIHLTSLAGIIVLSAGFFLLSLSFSDWSYFLSALLIGVGYGTIFPAFLFLFINMANHNQRGTANSTYYTSFDIGIGVGMILAGKIAEISSLSTAFGVSALFSFISIFYYWKISLSDYEKKKLHEEHII